MSGGAQLKSHSGSATEGGGQHAYCYTASVTWSGAPCCHAGDHTLSLSVCGDGWFNLYTLISQYQFFFSDLCMPILVLYAGLWSRLSPWWPSCYGHKARPSGALTQGCLQPPACWRCPHPRTRRQTATSAGRALRTALSPSGSRSACPRRG